MSPYSASSHGFALRNNAKEASTTAAPTNSSNIVLFAIPAEIKVKPVRNTATPAPCVEFAPILLTLAGLPFCL